MLQTKGIETTTRELDFPCFLQNKYLFATKAAGRMRHVPLTLKACVFAPAAVEVWSSTKCYLRSGWAPSPPACELTSSATCAKEREEGGPGSPAGIYSKWKAKWAVGLPLGVLPTLHLLNSIISSTAIVQQPHVLAFGMSSKGMKLVQKFFIGAQAQQAAHSHYLDKQLQEMVNKKEKSKKWRWVLGGIRSVSTSGCCLWKDPWIS